jgi:hypothetical protein
MPNSTGEQLSQGLREEPLLRGMPSPSEIGDVPLSMKPRLAAAAERCRTGGGFHAQPGKGGR